MILSKKSRNADLLLMMREKFIYFFLLQLSRLKICSHISIVNENECESKQKKRFSYQTFHFMLDFI